MAEVVKRARTPRAKPDGRLPVSVIILTKDEERNLPGCLASLAWAKQVVVVDSGSTDRTVALARRAKAQVYVNPWPGFTAQRNFALDRCRQPWVLSVDADERVAPDLEAGIRALLKAGPQRQGYRVREVNLYFGRWLRYGGIYPGEHMIFFRRQGARYASGKADVHEGVQVADPGRLRGHLTHHAYPSLELALDKLNSYTGMEAQGRLKAGRDAGWGDLLLRPPHRFLNNYLRKRGFLDGPQGLLYCVLNSYYTFCFHLKIWEQRRRERLGLADQPN
jgi:glycosyltransferase involved in cell wall biosynthesis